MINFKLRNVTHWLLEDMVVISKILCNRRTHAMRTSCEIAVRRIPQETCGYKTTLVKVQSHYRSQCPHGSMSPHGLTRPQWVKNYRMTYPIGILRSRWYYGKGLFQILCRNWYLWTVIEYRLTYKCDISPLISRSMLHWIGFSLGHCLGWWKKMFLSPYDKSIYINLMWNGNSYITDNIPLWCLAHQTLKMPWVINYQSIQ